MILRRSTLYCQLDVVENYMAFSSVALGIMSKKNEALKLR